MPIRSLFISSVQKEMAEERRAVKAFVEGDPLLRRYFTAFLFEDLPASDRRADDVYLDEVNRCAVYVGLFGHEYGFEDVAGVAPTEREFDQATARGKPRLIFVKGADDKGRHPKMQALVRKAGAQLIRRRFSSVPDLTAALYASLVEQLERTGHLQSLPFDAAPCAGATLNDISADKLKWFLDAARRERDYPLSVNSPSRTALAHLNLLDGNTPTHAAMLLLGKNPQRFLPAAEVKCLHFHGTEVRKPIPSYQVYKGTIFDQVDRAVDFVMAQLARRVGTRAHQPKAPVEYDLPKAALTEAIVNAVAHRDYTSNAGVQVMLFVDRLEVWNPGELPSPLTPERLRKPHSSIPRSPLIAEPLYLAHYIEKAGTGTLDMIDRCREAGLPEPDFEERAGQFVVTLWRDWLTEAVIEKLRLNERQKKGMVQLRTAGRITNADYQRASGATPKTSMRDLAALVERAVLERIGTRKGAYYRLARKWDINGTFGTRAGTSSEKTPDEKRSDDMRQIWDKGDSAFSRKKSATKPTTEEARRKKRNGKRSKRT